MHFSLPTILSLTYHVFLASSLQLSLPRTLPSPQTIIPSPGSRHSVYIDQKIQIYRNTTTEIPLNHNLYHQRNVNAIPPNTSNISLNHELYSKRNAIASPPAQTPSGMGSLDNATDVDTETACISALAALHGSASNPAGVAACYNILAFDNATGVFGAEIRLYSVAKPRGGWVEADIVGEGVDVGVVFERARTLSIGSDGSPGSNGTVWKRDRGGSEVEASVPPIGREKAKDLWRSRNAVVPAYVGGIEIDGRVDGNISLVAIDVATLRNLLTPTITLSGSTPNATNLAITLSTNATSFLTGLLALPRTKSSEEPSVLTAAGSEEEYLLPGTTMVVFPTSLIITTIWTLLCLAVQGYGVLRKWRAREEYRRRVRRRVGGGGGGGWCRR